MTINTYYNYNRFSFQTPINNNFEDFITFHEESFYDELPQQNNFSSYLDEGFIFPSSIPYLDTNYLAIHPSQLDPNFDTNYLEIHPSQLDQNNEIYPFQHLKNEIFPLEDNCYYNSNYLLCPKRQKSCYQEDEILQNSLTFPEVTSTNYLLDVPNPSSFQVESFCLGQEFNAIPDVNEGTFSNDGIVDGKFENKESERAISPQSKAARERRRKITEKTQELGKLVPGGLKMNTAEMLNAASKYVKYLQAQVGMLQYMEETFIKEDKAAPPTEDLHKLLVSPCVQEKLYSEEKCFVPKEFVTTLINQDDVGSKSTIFNGLKQLIGTGIEKKPKHE